jgi:hypothetical protein
VIDPKIYYPGLLMIFGSVVAATLTALPRAHTWRWMHSGIVPFLSNVGGLVAGCYSIYFLGSRLGWGRGILTWLVVGVVSAIIVRLAMPAFPLVLALGLVCMYVGFALALFL